MIPLAKLLELPDDFVTEKTSILAKSGAGKSNTAKVLVEGALALGAQVVILDPVGHWWGLRSLFPIPVIGGMMGDVPLDAGAGKLLARVVVESGQSMVLDVSLFDSDGEMQRFAYEFAEEFYKRKQANPTAVLLVLEEADEFAPQDTRGANVPRMVGAYNRIAKRGRGRGIGLLLVTLRSAALNKNVLNQSDTIIAMRTTAPLDIEAIKEWVKYHRVEGADEVIPSLSGLKTGEGWVWTPERQVLVRAKFTKARSLDTSATPKLGDVVQRPKALKPIDLAALGEQIQEFASKAKADDPEALRKLLRERDTRVNQLERKLSELEETLAMEKPPPEVTVEVEKRVLSDDDRVAIADLIARLRDTAEPAANLIARLDEIVYVVDHEVVVEPRKAAAPPPAPAPRPRVDPPVIIQPPHSGNGNGDRPPLKAGARRILEALASHYPMRMTRSQVATLAKLKKSGGTFGSYWSSVKVAGLIDEAADGTTTLTQAGIDYVGADARQPATPEEMLELWRPRLKAGARSMLDQLVQRQGEWMSREELAAIVNLEPSGGTFGSYLSMLKTAGLADVNGQQVRAAEVLFLGVVA